MLFRTVVVVVVVVFFEGGRWEGRQCLRSNFPRNFVIFTTKKQ